MNRILSGALAGLAATAPMSLAMKLMHEQLPREEQYPLPPREITEEVAGKAGVVEQMDEEERQAATWASHFAYGAACGALYGALSGEGADERPALAGVGFGLAVWGVSYLGWLPAAGILAPATEHPARRTALMIAAHVVWGVTTGLAVERLSNDPAGRGARGAEGER